MVIWRCWVASLALLWSHSAGAATVDCVDRLRTSGLAVSQTLTARTLVELRDFGGADNRSVATAPFSVSPDGKWAAMILRRADVETDSYCHGIVLVAIDGRAPPRLLDVGGEFISIVYDSWGNPDWPNGSPETIVPNWSPDGRRLAYLRRDAGVTQVWIVGLDDAPARQITRLSIDARTVNWSPDGRRLLVTTRPAMETAKRAIEVEGRTGFHFDKRFWPTAGDRPAPLPPVPSRIDAYDTETGAWLQGRDQPDAPQTSGGTILTAEAGQNARAWTERSAAPGSKIELHISVNTKDLVCPQRVCGDGVRGIWWTRNHDLVFLAGATPGNGGRTALYLWHPGGAFRRLLDTEDALFGCQLVAEALICAREAARMPRYLSTIDIRTGRARTVFDPNPDLPVAGLGRVERLRWNVGSDGATYGNLVLPPDHKVGQHHPLVVTQYDNRGFVRGGTGDEEPIFLLAARGYAVLSVQRPADLPAAAAGKDFIESQRARIKDFSDRRMLVAAVNTGVDSAIARGVIDPDRIGLTGLSDGAATAQFILSHPNRFKAAMLSSCCDEPSSVMFLAGPAFRDMMMATGYPAPGDGMSFWKQYSMAANAREMRTPLLLQLADREYRYGLETFNALQVHGAPVDMYVFPDEYHIKWHPAHRFAVYNRVLTWFDFWLRGMSSKDPAEADEIARWSALRASLRPGS